MFNAIAGLFQSQHALSPPAVAPAAPFVAEGPNAWALSLSNGPVPSAPAPALQWQADRLAAELSGEQTSRGTSAGQFASVLKTIRNRPLSGFLEPLPAGDVRLGVDELDEIPIVALIQALWSWAIADPCKGFDAYANGGFKLSHPMTSPMASAIGQARIDAGARLLARLQAIPDDAIGTEGMLRSLYDSALRASAQHGRGEGWAAFTPQADAIAALATESDVINHLCGGAVAGRASVLGLLAVFDEIVVTAEITADGPSGLDPGDPVLQAHLDSVAGLLIKAGMKAADATGKAPVVHAMSQVLAAASLADYLQRLDLASAAAAVPGFPFDMLWQQLGLDPAVSFYVTSGSFRAVADLLVRHGVDDWRAFLLYLEARKAEPFIEMTADPEKILDQLEQVAGPALGQLYANGTDPARERQAQALFSQLQATFIEDVAASSLNAADQKVLCDAIALTRLHWEPVPVHPLPRALDASDSYLANLQVLVKARIAAALHRLGQPMATALHGANAHDFALAFDLNTKMVALSPAMLDALWDIPADAADARCGAIGSALGHELGHLLADLALSKAGETLRQQQDRAIVQRVDGRAIGAWRVNGTRVLDEVAADLRGTSAAYRVCEAAATTEGRHFNPGAFFEGIAAVHAANPSGRQLQARLRSTHPPGPVRADLLAEVRGFEAAFGCDPAPRNPFHRVI